MVHRKLPHDYMLPAWNYLHVHWVRGLGLVPGSPKCLHCRDCYPRCRWRSFSACSALTRRWDAVVTLYISFCPVVHTCTMVVTILPNRFYRESERTIDWLVSHGGESLMKSVSLNRSTFCHKRRAHFQTRPLLARLPIGLLEVFQRVRDDVPPGRHASVTVGCAAVADGPA